MVTDILIKTYPGDYQWLPFCLKSIHKFVKGVRQVVIAAPPGDDFLSTLTAENVIRIPDRDPGYLWQQAVKLSAPKFTSADRIIHVDSDMVFTREFTPEMLLTPSGKIKWRKCPWAKCGDSERKAWHPVMSKFFLGRETHFEYMRQSLFMVPRDAYKFVDTSCYLMHGMGISDYVMRQPRHEFSEYNVMGRIFDMWELDDFEFVDTTQTPETDTPFVRQFWSWGGLTEEIQQEIDRILA